jgi:regulator of Ty1 transposition protein 103
LKESNSNKRLNLIYLANGKPQVTGPYFLVSVLTRIVRAEVAQQTKARRKDDFLIAFSPVIAEATATAYKGATNDVQQKLRRVVEVWRQRSIFEPEIQQAIEARIQGTYMKAFLKPQKLI